MLQMYSRSLQLSLHRLLLTCRPLCALGIWTCMVPCLAQQPTSDSTALPIITISMTRLALALTKTPIGISVLDKGMLALGQPQVSLQEGLVSLPGVVAVNADNFSQDLRIAVRGFGARAAFGIRGVRLMVDGLPETTPDGQGQVDNVDPSALVSAEVLRGAAAALYGNASGGVVHMNTGWAQHPLQVNLRSVAGSYGLRQYRVQAGVQRGKVNALGTLTRLDVRGYRPHSGTQSTIGNLKVRFTPQEKSQYTLLLNYANSPWADDAGALTAAEVAQERRQANAANITFQAGEALAQGKIGLLTKHILGPHMRLEGRAYTLFRQFENKLAGRTAGIVAFDRQVNGLGLTLVRQWAKARLRASGDWENQRDDRQRYLNEQGQRGVRTVDQVEQFTNSAAGLAFDWQPTARWTLLANARADHFRLALTDRFLSDGDDQGKTTYTVFNPMVGASFQVARAWHLYANAATAFETPTLNELANPNGAGGFNLNLQPQRSRSTEIGAKGQWGDWAQGEVALFYIATQNEIFPYQLVANGRTFYRNVGETRRQGMELSGAVRLYQALRVQGAYTYSRFRYTQSFQGILNGSVLPGVSPHTGFVALQWWPSSGPFAVAQAQYTDAFGVRDGLESPKVAAAWLMAARAGYGFAVKRTTWSLFAGIQNLTNTAYFSNIRLNAAGGRYYEPGAPRTLYIGVSVSVQ